MPVLERVAGLDPCSLQRVLPSTRSPFKSRRKLHTAFWQHGAAEIELSSVWRALVRGPMDVIDSAISDHKGDSTTGSFFLLDFLYPSGTLAFLRHLSPPVLGRHDRQRRCLGLTPRLYTSSTVHDQNKSIDPEPTSTAQPFETAVASRHHDTHNEAEVSGAEEPLSRQGGPLESARQEITRLLASPKADFDRVWFSYRRLGSSLQLEFRRDVILFLATSGRVSEAWKVSELCRQCDLTLADDPVVGAAIKAKLSLREISEAVAIFVETASTPALSAEGLGHLLAHGLGSSAWDLVNHVWTVYRDAADEEKLNSLNLKELGSVDDLSQKLSALRSFSDQHPAELPSGAASKLDSLLQTIAKKALLLFNTQDAIHMLERLNDPLVYEDVILKTANAKQHTLASTLYRSYRKLPNVRVRIFVLRVMLNIYFPKDVEGLEQVLADWYSRYDRLDVWVYRKFLAFYAARGDANSVYRLWDDYIKNFPDAITQQEDTFVHLLNCHVQRGELELALRLFEEMESKYGVKPNRLCWNVILNAVIKTGNYDKALDTFGDLCDAVGPDDYSFGTILGYVGSRGDLEFALYLFRQAKLAKVKMTVALMDAIVEAYCQNDRFTEAERLCSKLTKSKELSGDYAELWNTLIRHYAHRRDLASINRLLEGMAANGVAYDNKTYDALLLGLLLTNQSHHAYHMLRIARVDKTFEPTQKHYVLLMSAFLKTNEPHMVLKVSELMKEMGFSETASSMVKVIEALTRWQSMGADARQKGRDHYLGRALQEMDRLFKKDERRVPRNAPKEVASQAVRIRSGHFAKMIFLFTQMKDLTTVNQLVDLYNQSFPRQDDRRQQDIELLTSVMHADFHDKKFDRVREAWDIIYARAKETGRSENGARSGRPVPRFRPALNEPLGIMQLLLVAEGDAEGLVKLVAQITADGFELDSKNWNHYVQNLARMKRWREAFFVCEERLMPNWGGWYRIRMRQPMKNRLSLDLRRLGSSPRYYRPTSYTLMVLAREYLEMEQTAPWSRHEGQLFAEVNEKCARVVRALRTMVSVGNQLERDIFGDPENGEEGEPDLFGSLEDGGEEWERDMGGQSDTGGPGGMPEEGGQSIPTHSKGEQFL